MSKSSNSFATLQAEALTLAQVEALASIDCTQTIPEVAEAVTPPYPLANLVDRVGIAQTAQAEAEADVLAMGGSGDLEAMLAAALKVQAARVTTNEIRIDTNREALGNAKHDICQMITDKVHSLGIGALQGSPVMRLVWTVTAAPEGSQNGAIYTVTTASAPKPDAKKRPTGTEGEHFTADSLVTRAVPGGVETLTARDMVEAYAEPNRLEEIRGVRRWIVTLYNETNPNLANPFTRVATD